MPNYKVDFWTGNYQEAESKADAIRIIIQRIKDDEIGWDDFTAVEVEEADAS